MILPPGCMRREGGGGGVGTHKCRYQKWPDQIFPTVNCVFSDNGHFGLGGGGPLGGVAPLLRWCTAILILPSGGGGGSGTQMFVYQKWPKAIFPFVNFIFSHYEIRVQGGGGGYPPSSYGCQPF